MNMINRITAQYKYHYFDKHDHLQTKSLNVIQYLLRRIFGCYAETHLNNVVKKAYQITLKSDFVATGEERQQLLKLIAKAYRFSLRPPEYQIPSTKKDVSISLSYSIQKRSSEDYKISGINFKFDDKLSDLCILRIFKNKSNEIVADLPSRLFKGDRNNSEEKIKDLLTGKMATLTTNILAKTLNDSVASSALYGFQFVQFGATDYRSFYSQSSTNMIIPDDQNGAQETAMDQLGWTYWKKLDTRLVYYFDRTAAEKNQVLAASGFNQNLSLNFAVQSLEAMNYDY
jgi:hypothetical protein